MTNVLVSKLMISGGLLLLLAIGIAFSVGNRIAKPLNSIIEVAKHIAEGDVYRAKNELKVITEHSHTKKWKGAIIRDEDETTQLVEAFNTMTSGLVSLIEQMQRSGIHNKSTFLNYGGKLKTDKITFLQNRSI